MAKKKKKLRQKGNYNPNKIITTLNRFQAAKCLLYHWVGHTDNVEDYSSVGPFSDDKTQQILTAALKTPNTWLCTVIACFVTEDGDYYEEMISFPPYGPTILAKNPEDFAALRVAAIAEAKNSGNPKHYVDTTVCLSVFSRRLSDKMNDDNWIREQAGRRATLILEHHSKAKEASA